jgi:O-antigen ligase
MATYQHPDWSGQMVPETAWTHYSRMVSFSGILLALAFVTLSPALLSIGVAALVLPSLVSRHPLIQLQRFWKNKPAVLFSLLFFVHLLSGIWSRESAATIFWDQTIIKAPLLFTPFAVSVMGPYPLRWVRIALSVLLLSTFVTATGSVLDYALHHDAINEAIRNSKEVSVWTGINHIYFSILCGFSALSTIWLLRFRVPALFRGEKWVIGIMGGLNFLFMHVMTTRTGLVGVYMTLMVLGFVWVVRERKYLIGVLAAIVLFLLPIVGYYTVTSFQRRLDNSIVDVQRYFGDKDPNYLSIGTRFESWKAAWHIFQNNPAVGVGMADIKEAMIAQYLEDESRLCPENFILPHNQFLMVMAGYGFLGLLAFGSAWFYPLFQRNIPRSWLFWGFWIISTASMMGESILERQVGVNFVCIMFMLALSAGVQWPGQDKASWR